MIHEKYIRRCIQLAKLASGRVGLNPNVGAVLVCNGKIIGEGYYEYFGGPHAEVNAFNSVVAENRNLISQSTLYVSLEPCNVQGKTPPCSLRIIEEKVKSLVLGCSDPNPKIAGSSIQYLREHGVSVITDVLKNECEQVIRQFRVNILEHRPYVSIKFAKSRDNYIGQKDQQVWLSNSYSKVFSHKLRSENHGILIGTNTALIDNPSLTNRLYSGTSPLRIVIDKENKIPDHHHLISDKYPTLIINSLTRPHLGPEKEQWTMDLDLQDLLARLYSEKQIGRLIVEGGAATIKVFVKEKLWDETHVIDTPKILGSGIRAPHIIGSLVDVSRVGEDVIRVINKN